MNYTPLTLNMTGAKEAEPVVRLPERTSSSLEAPVPRPHTEQYLEQVSENVPLSDELQKAGVSVPPAQSTLMVDGRIIHLPMALEKLEEGRKMPMSSGQRWITILIDFLLDKLHLVIRHVGGKIQVKHA